MKHTTTVVLIAFIFLSSTCQKAMQVPDPELQKIFGKWEWIFSIGGFAGKTITPASEKYNQRLEFTNDGLYKKYKNDSLIDRKKFSFSQSKSIQSLKQVWTISFDESSIKMAILPSGHDTLVLEEQVYDGFGHVYARIK